MKGKIIKYFEEKGYGFILDEKGEKRFFHISDTLSPLDIKEYLFVEFEPSKNKKGLSSTNIKITNKSTNTKFINIYDTNIKCSNIKQFGIAKANELFFKKSDSFITDLFGVDTSTLITYEDLPELYEFETISLGKDLRGFEEVEVPYNYLYITTYQGDNYKWKDDLETLEKKLKYIQDSLS